MKLYDTTVKENTHQDGSQPAAWIGCLSCYNGGKLVGAWFQGSEEIEAFEPPADCEAQGHEEFSVMDTENLPGGEMSVIEAAERARAAEDMQAQAEDVGVPVEVLHQYYEDNMGNTNDGKFQDSLESSSQFETAEEYATEYYESTCGYDIPPGLHIDWEGTAADLLLDFTVYYFEGNNTYYAFPNY